jgi:hypothetical protein
MMMNLKKFFPTLTKVALAATTVFAMTQCSEEQLEKPASEAAATEQAAPVSDEKPSVLSLTVSGAHKMLSSSSDCKTCTFVVPANTTLIDGLKLDLQPGDTVCLDAAIKYGALEFVNFEGTEENPVIIAYRTPETTGEDNSSQESL